MEKEKMIMRKLKEREAGINQCLKGRMKVRVITKVINNRTLEGYVLEVEDENFHPVVYEEKKWEDMTDQEVAELLYQFRMNSSIHENYSLLFNPKVSTEEIRSKIRPMLMSEDRVNELEAQGIITDQKEGFTVLYVVFVPEDGVDISIRLTSALLSYYKLKREEIERIAFDQIEKEVVIESVSPKVGKLYGRGYGSSALLCDSIKKEIQERFGEGCCLLPVSVDITIILSNDFAKQTEFLKILAKSISLSIDECNQLSQIPYVLKGGRLKAL